MFFYRRVFGYSTLLASILTLLTPVAAVAGFGWVVALRILLGFLLGATWPAILPMASKWIPPMDRSKFMSNMMGKSLLDFLRCISSTTIGKHTIHWI